MTTSSHGTQADIVKLLRLVEQTSGWRVKSTAQGYMIYAPDGVSMITVHKTTSDWRAVQNMKRHLRRAGWQSPDAVSNGKK